MGIAKTWWDFFIVHPTSIDTEASELYELLKKRSFKVFVDHISIKPGSTWAIEIDKALINSSIILILIPGNNIDSSFYTQTEIISSLHLARSFPDVHKAIPIYLDGMPNDFLDIYYALRLIQGVDVSKEGGLEKIISILINLYDSVHLISKSEQEGYSANRPVHALHMFPTGPLVELFLVRRTIIEAFAKTTKSSEAKLILSEANAFRIEADPNVDPDSITINQIYLPDPSQSLFDFWQSVFAEACLHGPRMLASIILTIPNDRFPVRAKNDRQVLLEKLKKHL